MDGSLIESFRPKAIKGMTPEQAEKMNKVVASNFDRDQIQSIKPECLDAMPKGIFNLLEDDLSASQLNGLENL